MIETVIDWDGTHLPGELRELPPGRYVVTPAGDDDNLTEEEAGILLAIEQVERGEAIPLQEATERIRQRIRQR